jgi:type IV secretory pathway VirB3-like protein
MNTGLMITCMLLSVLLIKVSPFLSVVSLVGVFWFGARIGAADESRFLGIVFLFAVAGIFVVFGQYLIQSLM